VNIRRTRIRKQPPLQITSQNCLLVILLRHAHSLCLVSGRNIALQRHRFPTTIQEATRPSSGASQLITIFPSYSPSGAYSLPNIPCVCRLPVLRPPHHPLHSGAQLNTILFTRRSSIVALLVQVLLLHLTQPLHSPGH
jgi:hypothetical protein